MAGVNARRLEVQGPTEGPTRAQGPTWADRCGSGWRNELGFALRGLRGSGTAKRRISSQVRWLSVARTSTWRTPNDDKIFAVSGYDVIGDIHGQADKLVGLLRHLGYNERQGAWRHSERTAVSVGDLIDRGPRQLDSIRIPRAMVEAGTGIGFVWLAVELPVIQSVVGTVSLSSLQWLVVVLLAMLAPAAVEVDKAIRRRG